MGVLFVALALVGIAGPLVLAFLLRAELRRGEPRVTPLLVLASVQTLAGTWAFGVLTGNFLLEPWLSQQPGEDLARAAHAAASTAAIAAVLWLPLAVALLVLFVRALHRGEADRLQLPLVAIVLYGGALVWGAARWAAGGP